MDIVVEKISDVKRRIVLTADAGRVSEARNEMYRTLRKQAQIRGFRPGKAPRSLLERHYGDHVNEEIRGELLEEGLKKAVEEHSLAIVARPEIEESGFADDGSFSARATVEVSPTIEPKDYKGLAVKRQKVQVADRAVEDRLKRMAEMRAQLRTIEEQRPAKDGDIVEVTFEGTIDGEPFEGGKGENQLLELGSGSFIPGFEDGVKGLGAGEEKDLDLTFPEDYGHKPLAGKAARFHVTLGAIKERVIPALDDEFAKDVSAELASLDELRARERESLRGEAAHRARHFDRDEAVKALLAANDFDVPDSMVARQTASMVENMRRSLSYSGMRREDVQAIMDGADERTRPEAVREVKATLLLDAIAAKEGLECADEDLEARYAEIAGRYNRSVAEIAAEYQKDDHVEDLKFSIRQDKALDFLFEHANVTWVDPPKDDDGGEE